LYKGRIFLKKRRYLRQKLHQNIILLSVFLQFVVFLSLFFVFGKKNASSEAGLSSASKSKHKL